MIEIICLFFPTFLSLENNYKKDEIINIIRKYCVNNVIINFVVLTIVGFLNNFEFKVLDLPAFNLVFSIKYLLLSSITAIIIKFFEKNIFINIEIERKKHENNR